MNGAMLSGAVGAGLLSIGLSVAQLALFAFEGDVGAGVLGLGAFLTALSVVLVLLTSRKRSNFARWVLVVLTLFGIASAGVGLGVVTIVGAVMLTSGFGSDGSPVSTDEAARTGTDRGAMRRQMLRRRGGVGSSTENEPVS